MQQIRDYVMTLTKVVARQMQMLDRAVEKIDVEPAEAEAEEE